jgi:hypothetical protein
VTKQKFLIALLICLAIYGLQAARNGTWDLSVLTDSESNEPRPNWAGCAIALIVNVCCWWWYIPRLLRRRS